MERQIEGVYQKPMTETRLTKTVKEEGELLDLYNTWQMAKDLGGLVSDEQLRAPEGEVEHSTDVSLMERTALAIVKTCIESEDNDNEDMLAGLNAVGVSPAMYAQMWRHPDFRLILEETTEALIVIPRWPKIRLALSKLAIHGDIGAIKTLLDTKLEEDRARSELLKLYQGEGGHELFIGELNSRIDRMTRQRDRMIAPVVPAEVIEEERLRTLNPTTADRRHNVKHSDLVSGESE
jgi:hypothetical protein